MTDVIMRVAPALRRLTGPKITMSTVAANKEANALVFDQSLELAKRQQLSIPELIKVAEGLKSAGDPKRTAELYKAWVAFNPSNSHIHLVYFNLSVALREIDDLSGAIDALRTCTKLDPLFGPANINLGRALEDAGQRPAAIRHWQEFVEKNASITPDRINHKLMALQHIGRVLENSDILSNAEDTLRQAISLRPDKTEAAQHWIAIRQRQCKWPVLQPPENTTQELLLAAMSPMALAAYADDPMFQLARAHVYNKTSVGRPDTNPFGRIPARKKIGSGRPLRIGYVSSDLREHAVGFALSEVLELHDKTSVEMFAYYCGEPRTGDRTQERIKTAVDHWRDISQLSDMQAAATIVADEIDILVDINGYTKHARTKIFAYRPAPVIVNWCGYPGTMGSPYHQYLITDDCIVPPENEIYYSEKVLRIACNQPLDRKRTIDRHTPTRAEVGLPENAFVYACFNGMQKITSHVFERWMSILAEVPDSVLWLLAGTDDTNQRLRAAASQRGVNGERIIFAGKAGNSAHLARIALADLFLDTQPYGAHSTAADALTMGLPILTVPGRSFAARFCASVVSAAGLRPLICATLEDYVSRAIAFGRDPASLAPFKALLQRTRDSSVLRDIPGLARRLEELFWQMQGEAESGETPVPDLTNLDIYYEIGSELDWANVEGLDDDAYRRLYEDKLARLDDFSPIARDGRFWTDQAARLRGIIEVSNSSRVVGLKSAI